MLVQWLVLTAFIGPRPPKMDACHNDGDGSNNNLSNLRWDTRSGNFADKNIHGTHQKGSRNGHAKLKESDIPVIRQLHREGSSLGEIALIFGVAKPTISGIIKGTRWKHV